MKSNELRIGNITHEMFDGNWREVVVSSFDIYNQEEGFIDLFPIPLTEEWLLKFGFVANRYNDVFELYPLMFDCEYTDKGEWNISYDGHPLSTEIQHVHQLQNLYFALTGEELTIKL